MIINFHLFIMMFLLNIPFSLCKPKDLISLEWSVCDLNPETVLEKLGKKDIEPYKITPISYFDTDPPSCINHGLMFRKKIKSKQEVTVVKKKFMDDSIKAPDADCVWSRYGSHSNFVCMIRSPLNGTTIWSNKQIRFVEGVYSKIHWNQLVEYGPYINPKWKSIKIHGYKVVFDDVIINDSLHLMEFEVKVPKYKGHSAYKKINKYLKKKGIVLCDKQETKSLRLFRHMGYLDAKNDQNHKNQKSFGFFNHK
ncbi:unnamed protein product [Cunninghamella blakesleeana]